MRRVRSLVVPLLSFAALLQATPAARAATLVVAPSGGSYTTIQAALDIAQAGDTILVRETPTPYFEKLVFPRSGNGPADWISLEAWPGERPVIDGTGVAGQNLVLIESCSFVRLRGFELRHLLGADDGSGVRIVGHGSSIEILDNRIHALRGESAMGITVYGTDPQAITDLVIADNEIWDADPAPSEALTLNGNVDGFVVERNFVHDVNNIGIDAIGGEQDIQPDPSRVARNGVFRDNRVERARSSYGGGFAAGLYVDGGRDLVLERNMISACDLGIEIGAENTGIVTSNVVVRDNLVHDNDKAGIAFGGYAAFAGRVSDARITHNTLVGNDTLATGFGEIWVQYASNSLVAHNLVVAGAAGRLLTSEYGNIANLFDHNLWWAPAGAGAGLFSANGDEFVGFAAYRAGTGQDANSIFAAPELVDPAGGDFRLGSSSPAIDVGDPLFLPALGETDFEGGARVNGPRVDLGADESTSCGDGVVQLPEICDDGAMVDGDGCDANCTPTGCGNAVVTAGEQCDDGGLVAGDCCSPTCALEADGSACDDTDACTRSDVCLAGTCTGTAEPEPTCAVAQRSSLTIDSTRRRLIWTLTQGDALSVASLGDPIAASTGYDLCLYDRSGGAGAVVARAAIRPGGNCDGRPCWKRSANGALRYVNRSGLATGVQSLRVVPGTATKTKLSLKAGGIAFDPPALPLAADPSVTVQVRSDAGACVAGTFITPSRKNDGTAFKDKFP